MIGAQRGYWQVGLTLLVRGRCRKDLEGYLVALSAVTRSTGSEVTAEGGMACAPILDRLVFNL